MCEKVNKTGVCQILGLASAVTALQVARIYEDGGCFGLEFTLSVPNVVSVLAVPANTGNCS